MFQNLKKFLLNRIINKHQIFYFISKIWRKSLPTQNKLMTIIFLFYNLILEIFFDLVTLFKFSTLIRKDDFPEKKFNGPRSSMVIQLIGMIYFIYFKKKITFFNKSSSFMDIGCGDGKVLFFSNIIFKKSYGVEINKFHTNLAKKNLKNSNVEILNQNVLSKDFEIPKDVNFFFFFSPFSEEEQINNFLDKLIHHSNSQSKKIILINMNCCERLDIYLKKNFTLIGKQHFFHYFENYFFSYN